MRFFTIMLSILMAIAPHVAYASFCMGYRERSYDIIAIGWGVFAGLILAAYTAYKIWRHKSKDRTTNYKFAKCNLTIIAALVFVIPLARVGFSYHEINTLECCQRDYTVGSDSYKDGNKYHCGVPVCKLCSPPKN